MGVNLGGDPGNLPDALYHVVGGLGYQTAGGVDAGDTVGLVPALCDGLQEPLEELRLGPGNVHRKNGNIEVLRPGILQTRKGLLDDRVLVPLLELVLKPGRTDGHLHDNSVDTAFDGEVDVTFGNPTQDVDLRLRPHLYHGLYRLDVLGGNRGQSDLYTVDSHRIDELCDPELFLFPEHDPRSLLPVAAGYVVETHLLRKIRQLLSHFRNVVKGAYPPIVCVIRLTHHHFSLLILDNRYGSAPSGGAGLYLDRERTEGESGSRHFLEIRQFFYLYVFFLSSVEV